MNRLGRRIRVQVPATTANLGPGFDTLGMALSLYNFVELYPGPAGSGLQISISGEGAESLPRDERNLVWQAVEKVFELKGQSQTDWILSLENNIPSARGLGSSAAAIIGGLLAAASWVEGGMPDQEILKLALTLEQHPDNLTAALLGGVTVVGIFEQNLIWKRLKVPPGMNAVVAIPEFELTTALACSLLPERVKLTDAVFNLQKACLLLLAFMENDLTALGRFMEDRLHQPYREELIPGLLDVFDAAKNAGALGAALSGAGPTVLALANGREKEIGQAMEESFAIHGIRCRIRILQPVDQGAKLSVRENIG